MIKKHSLTKFQADMFKKKCERLSKTNVFKIMWATEKDHARECFSWDVADLLLSIISVILMPFFLLYYIGQFIGLTIALPFRAVWFKYVTVPYYLKHYDEFLKK